MKIKPLGKRVLIQVKETEEKTKGGIYIPQTAQEKTQIGKVIAIGESDEIKVKVGSEVIFDKYAGSNIKLDNEEYLIISIEDVLGIIE